jgi:GNAT superfamily N-acetyltransferase
VSDAFVRPATPADAGALADVQLGSWRAGGAPPEVAALPEAEVAAAWEQAIRLAPTPRHRVLAACAGAEVVGFAALGPGEDERAAELLELHVRPARRREGHGSRLLAASVDHVRALGAQTATAWVGATEDGARAFLSGAGWAPDGSRRTLDLRGDGEVVVRQVRLHTDVGEA